MKVVPLETVPALEKMHPRNGRFVLQHLLQGEENSRNNFSLELARTFSDFYSPCHRHNCDQFRFQLEGSFDFGQNGSSPPGTVSYHPESVFYGPQQSSEGALVLVLQFVGASGNNYMSVRQIRDAMEVMKQRGQFDKGLYTPTAGGGEGRSQDATEAIWEHVNGRPIEYAPPRYQAPVFMHKDHFHWVPVPHAPGAWRRLLGTFTERQIDVGFLRLDAGSSLRLSGPKVYFVTAGSGTVGESNPYRLHTSVQVGPAEGPVLQASTDSELYVMGLPNFPSTERAGGLDPQAVVDVFA